ncbi:MAG: twin-arginine translocase subunit TatC [Acidobacteriota bacterium]
MQDENSGAQTPENDTNSYPNPSPEEPAASTAAVTTEAAPEPPTPEPSGGGTGGGGTVSTSGGDGGDDGDEDEEGMLRMSFLEHLEELRSRILKALAGVGVAFVLSLIFANDMWKIVSAPATQALKSLGFTAKLAQITPMETFSTVWVKVPMLAAIFLASPWVLYQVWAFIAPGLYKRERRWAAPFVISSAGLFILGGLFAYFVAFRFGLTFLLGIGRDINIQPMVSVTEYFDLFVNVMLGIGLVFELPVLIFFLTLLRIVTPGFLVRNSRYAVLVIVVLAAIVTPTPDVFNLMIFAVPMCLLFYVGVFGGYLLVLHRENRRFPWGKVLPWAGGVLLLAGAMAWYLTTKYGLHVVGHWPFLAK